MFISDGIAAGEMLCVEFYKIKSVYLINSKRKERCVVQKEYSTKISNYTVHLVNTSALVEIVAVSGFYVFVMMNNIVINDNISI